MPGTRLDWRSREFLYLNEVKGVDKMKSHQVDPISLRFVIPAFMCVLQGLIASPLRCQDIKELPANHGARSGEQAEVYWHDSDTRLDLKTSAQSWDIAVSESGTNIGQIVVPDEVSQVDLIHRAGPDRAVFLADLSAGAHMAGIITIVPPKLIDSFWTGPRISLSPDGHYVIFIRFYPMHGAEGYDDQYRLYDVLGDRSLNWPGRPATDAPPTEPLNYDPSLAGVPVYPLMTNEIDRDNTNVTEDQQHQNASEFVWSADSSKVVFADVQGGVMSLVVVYMPKVKNEKPKTEMYPLVNAENICSGSNECDFSNIRSLTWNDQTISGTFIIHADNAKNTEFNLMIPLSKFAPAER